MNALVEYIQTHPAWRTELTQKPYCLTIKDDGPYTIFSYSQIDSDFYNEVVRVSRGIILKITKSIDWDKTDLNDPLQSPPQLEDVKVVCWPFNKFERLPFGAMRYSVDEMSVVVDDDCMSTEGGKDEIKYLVLRPNCKLYTLWDDKGSLLF